MFLLSNFAVAPPSDAAFSATYAQVLVAEFPKDPSTYPSSTRLIMIVHLAHPPYTTACENHRFASLNDRHTPLTRRVCHFTLHLPQRLVQVC